MTPPEPMLSASGRRWPDGGDWILQPKWDGFRLLVGVDAQGRTRAWSRHGTNLTPRLEPLLARFCEVAPQAIFDGELVALAERNGAPAQDFRTVTQAVFTEDVAAAERLHFVGFDVLSVAGEDVRRRPWRERDACLRQSLPVCDRVSVVSSQPATPPAHAAIVSLGFEGTVLTKASRLDLPTRAPLHLAEAQDSA